MVNLLDKEYAENALKLYQTNKFETRDKSWNNCYNYFRTMIDKDYENLNIKEKEFAWLQLGFYLASWGMFRNSFLSQYDYSIYDKVLKIVLDKKYSILWNVSIDTLKNNKEEYVNKVFDISKEINKTLRENRVFYNSKSIFQRKRTDESEISQTLITKILLGVLGCCPAYDNYFNKATKFGYKAFYSEKKFENLVDNVIENSIFADLSKKYDLPIMKVVDIVYFQIGIEQDFKRMYELYIDKSITPTNEKDWKIIAKSLKDFYQQTSIDGEKTINVAFKFDKAKIDKFIKNNKKNIDSALFQLVL